MGSLLEHPDCVAALQQKTTRFADRVADADLASSVDSCPGWSVSDLVVHLGDVHRWATTAILEGIDADVDAAPGPGQPVAAWYRVGAVRLLDAIRSTPIDREVWAFGPPPHRVSFWSRRQLHETVVHLWDLESAIGDPSPVESVVAQDAIDEVCSMFYPRQVRLGRMDPLISTLALEDGTQRWLLGQGDSPDVTIAGRAADLMLLLWKRIGLEDARFEVNGDPDVARRALAEPITP